MPCNCHQWCNQCCTTRPRQARRLFCREHREHGDAADNLQTPVDWTLAILRRQEGEMSLTRDELSQSACSRERTSHATPARRHQTGLDPLCPTLFAPGLAPQTPPRPPLHPCALKLTFSREGHLRGHRRRTGDLAGRRGITLIAPPAHHPLLYKARQNILAQRQFWCTEAESGISRYPKGLCPINFTH